MPPDPIIDWCNFPARLRQSVREAAYLRMIFAQQFVVDALGLNFSGDLVGGENMVKNKELPKLQFAVYQYEEGEKRINEALGRVVGNGCYVSDFFTQTEWALLSSMAEKKELAQHQVAVRLSYLDIQSVSDVPRQQAKAQDNYRAAAMETYIKMAGMAGRGGPAARLWLCQHAAGQRLGSPDGQQHAGDTGAGAERWPTAAISLASTSISPRTVATPPVRRCVRPPTRACWLSAKCLADDAERPRSRWRRPAATSIRTSRH